MQVTNKSPWIQEVPLTSFKFPSLNTDLKVDVAIVGGGITGVMSAYLLSKAGKKVALLEKGKIGDGETSYTTAFITHAIDQNLQKLVQIFGIEKTKRIWDSAKSSMDMIEEIVQNEKIECEFMRVPAYYFSNSQKENDFIKKESEIAQKLGYDVSYNENSFLGIPNTAYLTIPSQAKFESRKFLTALVKIAREKGALIFENSKVSEICCENPSKVTLESGKVVEAEYIIVATHSPINNPVEIVARLHPCNTYVIEAKIPQGTLEEALYWDTDEPYHYLRIDRMDKYDRLILGGEDHLTGEEINQEERFNKLEEFLRDSLQITQYTIQNMWSGQVFESMDGIPFIGHGINNSKHLVATGFGGDGMIFGPLSAKINTDIILGNNNELIDLFSYKRLKAIDKIIQGGAGYVGKMIKERLKKKPSEVEISNLENENGKVIQQNGKEIAVFKDKYGRILKCSAKCTHMGCIVRFNDSQKTWDCPCHGSRFKTDGSVIAGPAIKPLEKIV